MSEGIERRVPAGDGELYAVSIGDGPAKVVLHDDPRPEDWQAVGHGVWAVEHVVGWLGR